jgi:hypothetical protein
MLQQQQEEGHIQLVEVKAMVKGAWEEEEKEVRQPH